MRASLSSVACHVVVGSVVVVLPSCWQHQMGRYEARPSVQMARGWSWV